MNLHFSARSLTRLGAKNCVACQSVSRFGPKRGV